MGIGNHDLPRLEEAKKVLGPYRGKRGEYRRCLGDYGELCLYVLCNGSPTTAEEFLGYTKGSGRNVYKRWKRLGLKSKKRDAYAAGADHVVSQTDSDIDDIRDKYIKATSITESAFEYTWRVVSDVEFVKLVCVSDLHYGSIAMDYPRWLKLRDWIAEDDVRWIFHGDLLDCATSLSPGLSLAEQALTYEEAMELATSDIEPIADKCVGMLTGNHDLRIARSLKISYDPVKEIAKRLGIKHFGYDGWVKWNIVSASGKSQSYLTYHHHGYGSGSTGAFVNRIKRLAAWNRADAIVVGHNHMLVTIADTVAVLDENGNIRYREVPLAGAGGFYRHIGYPREKGLSPSILGAATLHLYVTRKAIHARA